MFMALHSSGLLPANGQMNVPRTHFQKCLCIPAYTETLLLNKFDLKTHRSLFAAMQGQAQKLSILISHTDDGIKSYTYVY